MFTRLLWSVLTITLAVQCQPIEDRTAYNKYALPDYTTPSVDEVYELFAAARKARTPLLTAHRGGPDLHYPENAKETLLRIVDSIPVMLEVDIAMSTDSVLCLFHDASLDRLTQHKGLVKERLWRDLDTMRLIDYEGNLTPFTIPTMAEVLTAIRDKTILWLDIKRGVPMHKVVAEVQAYNAQSDVVYIVYNADDAYTIHALDPKALLSIRLTDSTIREQLKSLGVPRENCISFMGTSLAAEADLLRIRQLQVPTILGTLGKLDQQAANGSDTLYRHWHAQGYDIFSTDRPFAAFEVLYETSENTATAKQ